MRPFPVAIPGRAIGRMRRCLTRLALDQLGEDKHALFPGAFGSLPPARAITIQQTYVRASSPSTSGAGNSDCWIAPPRDSPR